MEIKNCRKPVEAGEENYAEIARIAHDIKGTAGVFELDEGTEISKKLQYVAQEGKVEETKKLVDKLTDYMRQSGVDI